MRNRIEGPGRVLALVLAGFMLIGLGLSPTAYADELVAQAPAGEQLAPVEADAEAEAGMKRAAGEIEEITVTATKREESIQDVPIAVSAFTGDDLERSGITDLEQLQQIAPSLSVYTSNSTVGGGTIRVRGVGTTGNNLGLEASVGSFLDGVYIPRAGLAMGDLVDIERVELLRGPQGTLFGKNTSAGALNIITKRPQFEWGGGFSTTYGSEGTTRIKGSITGPLVDEELAFRFAFSGNWADGYYDNFAGPDTYAEMDRQTGRMQLLWTPMDDLEVRTIYDYTRRDESCCPASYRFLAGPGAIMVGLGGTLPIGGDGQEETLVGLNHDPYEKVREQGVSIEANWDQEWGTLTSISAFRDSDIKSGQDVDFSNVPLLLPLDSKTRWKTYSQEIRAIGSLDELPGLGFLGSVDWLFGAYGFHEEVNSSGTFIYDTLAGPYFQLLTQGGDPAAINPFSLPGGFGLPNDFTAAGGSIAGDNNSEQKSDGWALFTHDTFNLADNLQLTGGFRWSWERKKGRYEILGTVDTPVDIGLNGTPFVSLAANATTGTSMCEQPTSTDLGPNALFGFRSALCDNAGWDDTEIETAPTGTVKLAYQPTEDIHTYLSYARGYKAGGYNYTGTANQQTAASIAAQELDPAAPTVLANEFRFDAEKVDAFEIGVKTNLLDNRLTVNSAIFYEDFKDFQVLSFTGTEFTLYNLPKATSKGIEVDMAYALTDYIYTTLAGAYTIARYGHFSEPEYQPQSGKRLTNSPRFQGNASVNIAQPIPQTTWTAILNTNVSYRSRVNTGSNLNPEQEQSSFWLTNAQVGIQSPNSQWTGLFWINNINNKRYNTIVFASPLQPGNWSSFVNPQRTFGVTLNYDY